MKNERITRFTLEEIREQIASGKLKGQTDWGRVAAKTDEDIERDIVSDPDSDPGEIDWSKATFVTPAAKTPISIRVDDDVLAFFKANGPGYQKRINAVLRSYMQHTQKRRARKKPDAAE